MKKNTTLILFCTGMLILSINSFQSHADELDDKMVTTKEAISIAIEDFQKTLGELPARFSLVIEQKPGDRIEISLLTYPIRAGGSLEITIDKKKGVIVERIQGQ